MAQYTENEVSNEVARAVRGRITVIRDGGLIDTATSYSQLLEVFSLTLLLNVDAVYYLGQLAANRLLSLTTQEINLVEDMLAAVEYLPRVGQPITDTTNLSNAYTSLLSVESDGSVTNRPELAIFEKNLDRFLDDLRPNVVYNGSLARPREEARSIIRDNLERLKTVHSSLLDAIELLKDLITNYKKIDIATKAAATMFENMRDILRQMQEEIDSSDDPSNLARSKDYVLKTLVAKAMVKLVADFKDPELLKYRSPVKPIPAGLTHTGRVIGEGEPPFIETSPGPWALPLSGDLDISVNGGTPQTVELTGILGATINGRNSESFDITDDTKYLSVLINDTVDRYDSVSWSGTTYVGITADRKMGYSFLGSFIQMPDMSGTDAYPRFITNFNIIDTGTGGVTWAPATNTLTITGASFDQTYVGMALYLDDGGGQWFEIKQVIDSTNIVIDPRSLTPHSGASTTWQVQGLQQGQTGSIGFSPAASIAATAPVVIGPTIKSGVLTTGIRTLAQIISDLEVEYPSLPTYQSSLTSCVKPRVSPADSTKLTLTSRLGYDPKIIIAGPVSLPSGGSADLPVSLSESAHEVLGFRIGEEDTDTLLTPSELVNEIVGAVAGVTAEVVEEDLYSGSATTDQWTGTLIGSVDFAALGVVEGCQVDVIDGVNPGTYLVSSVASNTIELRGVEFTAIETVSIRVFSEIVRITADDAGPGSSLGVSALTDIGIDAATVYGQLSTFEAVTKIGEKLTFSGVVAGDLLKVTGQNEVEIASVEGDSLTLATPLPSNVESAPFQIRGSSEKSFTELAEGLDTVLTSPSLLGNHKFNENLDALDVALTPALAVGQTFVSSLNRARSTLADLLAALTTSPRREDEYSAAVPDYGTSLEDVVSAYSAGAVTGVDQFLDALNDRKYDRASDLLTRADIEGFFNTNEENASYAGALVETIRSSSGDLPSETTNEYNVDVSYDLPVTEEEVPDALDDFSDAGFDAENYE